MAKRLVARKLGRPLFIHFIGLILGWSLIGTAQSAASEIEGP